jgi:hypothetical protein
MTWVEHSTHPKGHTVDGIGSTLAQGLLGPFPNKVLAELTAAELNQAYALGKQDKVTTPVRKNK